MLVRLNRRLSALHRLHNDRERKDDVLALLPPFATSFPDQHLPHFEHIFLEIRATRQVMVTRSRSGSMMTVSSGALSSSRSDFLGNM